MKSEFFKNNTIPIYNDDDGNVDDQSSFTSGKTFSVLNFYKNKTILITGSTGFVGKVLLEKLLRQCTTLRRIYVLIRSKKSQSSHERLNKMLSSSLLFKSHQDKIDKIQAIDGEIIMENLGLSDEDRCKLIEEVDVVFHSAAFIQFTGLLKNFLEQNIYGTNSLMRLCQDMKHLKSVVYVSTAYGNCHLREIEEKIYPVVNEQNVDTYLAKLAKNYGHMDLKEGHEALENRPNPYTLSKSVAEWLIEERYQSLPIIICRPSIVSNSNSEPFAGWSDAINGYSGLCILLGLGIAQSVIVNEENKTDIIPVDLVVNSLIISAAYRASPLYSDERKVVHITTSTENPVTWQKMFDNSIILEHNFPSMKQVRPISVNFANKYQTTTDKVRYKINQLLNHYMFALIFDMVCTVLGHKRFMMKITQRMHKSLDEVKYFSLREWHFHYQNLKYINSLVVEKERSLFNSDISSIDWKDYCKNLCLGCRRYLIKDPDTTIEQAKLRQYRLYSVFEVFDLIKYFSFYWIIKTFFPKRFLNMSFFGTQATLFDLLPYIFLVGFVFFLFKIFNKYKPINIMNN